MRHVATKIVEFKREFRTGDFATMVLLTPNAATVGDLEDIKNECDQLCSDKYDIRNGSVFFASHDDAILFYMTHK